MEKSYIEEFIDGILRSSDLTEFINNHVLDARLEIDLEKNIRKITFLTGFGGPNEYIEISEDGVARHVVVEPGRRVEKEYESPKVKEAFEILHEYFSEILF